MAKKLDINNYPGSKNGSGVKEWIINNIPEYEIFLELFGGSAIITRTLSQMVPEATYDVYEADEGTYNQLVEVKAREKAAYGIILYDGVNLLKSWTETNRKTLPFIYADPPYIKEARRGGRDLYNYEWTIDQHLEFLNFAIQYKGMMMISGYDHHIYNDVLSGWPTKTFRTMTRSGIAYEKIWMNYEPENYPLATTEFLGKNFTDRQRIKRKVQGYETRLRQMPLHERQAILTRLKNVF